MADSDSTYLRRFMVSYGTNTRSCGPPPTPILLTKRKAQNAKRKTRNAKRKVLYAKRQVLPFSASVGECSIA